MIFVPVLYICIALHCEFMQSTAYFKTQEQCEQSIEAQKAHITDLAKGNKITQLEGTCITIKLKEERWV